MGCVTSKQTVTVTPAYDHSGSSRDNVGVNSGRRKVGSGGGLVSELGYRSKKNEMAVLSLNGSQMCESERGSSNGDSVNFRLGNLQKYIEGEQVAAGWPAWLSAFAGEAIQGWVPLKAESFEKLEKIGQGTYSSVFRARNLETGKVVALKKVRFDNFEPEGVRFMAREIVILRRLNHPNIIKLDGIITSQLSCSLYLVFEYMEHDISGLVSSPDIKFSPPQIKLYMKQLLSGLEHCHSHGVMHRDIKGANLLVNNEGILKVADFGLANFCHSSRKQPLTSRVITLWYRPPELLLGSTDYGASVDLWSVGCVFAELHLGTPVLKGRTEVEQLHKIFKLCGSPSDDYWKKSKLPHATLFKPQYPYENCLWETFKDLPKAAVSLIETLLSVEPTKRGTCSSALASEYFSTKPDPCDPSSLPLYPPSKEIDAKNHEELAKRKNPGCRARGPETRKPSRKQSVTRKLAPDVNLPEQNLSACTISRNTLTDKKEDITFDLKLSKPSIHTKEETSHMKNASQGDVPFSGPLQVSSSSGFAWAKRRVCNSSVRSHSNSSSRSLGFELVSASKLVSNLDSERHENVDAVHGRQTNIRIGKAFGTTKIMLKNWSQLENTDSFDISDGYHSQEVSTTRSQREKIVAQRINSLFDEQGNMIELSGPLMSQSHKIDELLEGHERRIRQAVRRTWFQKGKKQGM